MEKTHVKKIYHKSLIKICPQCGNEFKVFYSNRNRYFFCSFSCRKASNAKKREAKGVVK